LSDSSFDSWIKFYRPDENSNNSRVSYYIKGCVVAFLLDARIREATDGAKSLDDLMRTLYAEHSHAAGFTEEDFRRVASSIAGVDLKEWFEQHVDQAVELDYEPALKWFGLQFAATQAAPAPAPAGSQPTLAPPLAESTSPQANSEAATSPTPTGEPGKAAATVEIKVPAPPRLPKAWLGMKASESGGQVQITAITPGSPAQAAGLNVGDELIALNQYRVSGGLWQTQLNQLGIGREIDLTIARRGEVRTLKATATVEPEANWNLKRVEPKSEGAEQYDSRMANWLGELPQEPPAQQP
jgi:predicted metalloprotease with PDZ domain